MRNTLDAPHEIERGMGTRMTQTAPAGWYPDPENSTRQRYWDGAAWTQNVAPTSPSEDAPQGLASADIAAQLVAATPVLQTWKTSLGFSVLGWLVGFPLLMVLSLLIAMPLVVLFSMLTGLDSPQSGSPIVALVGNALMLVYAAKVYPSYFSEKPRLRSSKAISFANFMFGGLIFGSFWNGNLSKRTKGSSYVVFAVLSGLMCLWLAFGIVVVLLPGPISSSANTPNNASSDLASQVNVGGVHVGVPAPVNFARVTPEMKGLYVSQYESVWPRNELLATLVPQEAATAALTGEVPDIERHFMLQVDKELKSRSVSKDEFLQLAEAVESQGGKLSTDTKDKLDKLLAEAGAEVSNPVVFPAHIKNDRMVAWSGFQKLATKTAEGTSVRVVSMTNTTLYVNHRVLFLYAYGQKDDLEWTREQSRIWANEILDANPE